MTTFWREGHWRWGQSGQHWVEGHWVDRDDGWSSIWDYSEVVPSSPSSGAFATSRGPVDPHARCPVCGAEVFFYSNEFGSRVYFDDLGPPWPKHPCMDNSSPRVSSPGEGETWGDRTGSTIRNLITISPTDGVVHIPGVFVVVEVVKRGPKRVVTLQEIGGERIEIVVSPPAPAVHAIAVSRGAWLHWFDPSSGATGKNLVWRKN